MLIGPCICKSLKNGRRSDRSPSGRFTLSRQKEVPHKFCLKHSTYWSTSASRDNLGHVGRKLVRRTELKHSTSGQRCRLHFDVEIRPARPLSVEAAFRPVALESAAVQSVAFQWEAALRSAGLPAVGLRPVAIQSAASLSVGGGAAWRVWPKWAVTSPGSVVRARTGRPPTSVEAGSREVPRWEPARTRS